MSVQSEVYVSCDGCGDFLDDGSEAYCMLCADDFSDSEDVARALRMLDDLRADVAASGGPGRWLDRLDDARLVLEVVGTPTARRRQSKPAPETQRLEEWNRMARASA